MSGQCLAQQNTQCDHGTGTVLRRTQGSTPAPKLLLLPCNDEFAQGNTEKSFFIPQQFQRCPN